MNLWSKVLLAAALAIGTAAQAQTRELKIAAAADLQPVMPAFQAAYEKKTGIKLNVSFASSSVLATQIINGAPFDVFLAADFSFPEKVVAANLSAEKEPIPYARGTLVLWARKDFPIQPLSVDVINDPRVTKIAIADQFHAPYGAAAYGYLTWIKKLDELKPKLVVAENIAQTAQFVVSGNTQVGFISLTSAESPQLRAIGTYALIPQVYPKIRQCAIVMKNSPHREEAEAFLKWMTSDEVQSHMKDFGLTAAE